MIRKVFGIEISESEYNELVSLLAASLCGSFEINCNRLARESLDKLMSDTCIAPDAKYEFTYLLGFDKCVFLMLLGQVRQTNKMRLRGAGKYLKFCKKYEKEK